MANIHHDSSGKSSINETNKIMSTIPITIYSTENA
eukprot:CAMPEP_0202689582 /NCGR_PEP_ID=MMETSP1385-20130828/4801_1 /ASSEMBLY_ACC=CAM_ASM_000861 /TAXON_ID=933848 /ORGANISM="Elphidium margaritaceum" /LENGTH=34 /DNA_ID= /DNA_START= /DNA_END= /DNA_ORIENTATION=